MTILGQVTTLAANDKVPGEYLESRDETGSGVGTRYLWIEAVKATSGGNLTADSEVREIFSDADALAAYGANSEGYRMCLRALTYGVPIKASAHSLSGSPAAATCTLTIGGTWTTTGRWYGRLAGRVIDVPIAANDTIQNVADNIAAYVNNDPAFAATAAVGAGPTYVITFTWGSQGVRGNDGILWQDTSVNPSGLTSTLGGSGSTVTSGGKLFAGGAGTESVASILTATFADEFYTQAASVRDATNLARYETQIDTKLGPLEGRLECFVGAVIGTLAAGGSIAQTTLNDTSFNLLWLEESETPGEELAAGWAAYRHLLESASDANDPNQRYDDVPLLWIVPQEAPSKRPSRATLVAALNYGMTPIATRNKRAVLVRAVTTRTLTDGGDVDDGTIDVGTDRVSKRYREELRDMLREHRQIHRYLDNDPAEGEEPTVDKNTTYPKRIADAVKGLNVRLQNLGWITQINLPANQPRVALNPDSSTPRAVIYAPHTPRPQYHQNEGVVAKKKFVVAATA